MSNGAHLPVDSHCVENILLKCLILFFFQVQKVDSKTGCCFIFPTRYSAVAQRSNLEYCNCSFNGTSCEILGEMSIEPQILNNALYSYTPPSVSKIPWQIA